MSRSRLRCRLLLCPVCFLVSVAAAHAVPVTFSIDPERSSLTSSAILAVLNRTPLTAQDAPDNTSLITNYTGTLELDVDDPLNPSFIQFLSGNVLGLPSGEWLPAVGGGTEGDPGIDNDADPGMPAEAQFGYLLDMGATATGYFALRDTALTATSDLLFVDASEFSQFITLEATQGAYEYNLSSVIPGLGDAAGSDDVTGEAADNGRASNGTYVVEGLLATLTLPVDATFGEGDDIEVTFAGELVATAFFGEGVAGDYNNNGLVEQADLDLVLTNWGTPANEVPASWSNDPPTGFVDQEELDGVLTNWGSQAGLASAAGVPEPSTLILLLLAPTPLIARLRW